jgi:glycosyltransferase involved in cell wall biosynthesis
VLKLAQEFRKRRIDCFVVFLSEGPSISIAKEVGIPFAVVRKKFPLDPTPIPRLVCEIAEKNITVIHTHTIRGNYYGRLATALYRGFLLNITTVHSHVLDELRGERHFGLKERLLCSRESCLWPLVDHFICVSKKIRGRLVSGGISGRRTSVVENAVDIPDASLVKSHQKSVRQEFNIRDDEIIVGTIGRLVPLKNHELFIKSAKQIAGRMKRVRFFVVGDGPLLESLVNQAKANGVHDAMIFTGWRQDVQRLMAAFDIYVICSLVEGFNLSVLEAMACGKPVVGTDVKGISEIVIDDQTGILVPSNNADLLTKAVVNLAEDKRKRESMGVSGKKTVLRQYPMDRMISDTLKIYDDTYAAKTNGSCGRYQ